MASGSKLEVSSGVWRLRVGAGKDPVTGRYLTRDERFKGTEGRADRRLKALVQEVERSKHAGPSTMTTVASLLDAWWPVVQADLSPSTVKRQTSFIEKTIKPRIGTIPLAKVDAAMLDRFYASLSARGSAHGGPLAPSSVRRVHNVMSSALGRAVKWGWLPRNPAIDATPPSLPVHRIIPPDPHQVRDIIDGAEAVNPMLPVFLRLAAVTGGRRSELVALRWSDVNVEKARLTIAHGVVSNVKNELVLKDTKTHGVRTISLGAEMLAMLRQLGDAQTKTAADIGIPLAGDPFLFSFAADGSEPWNPDYVTRAFDRIKHRLGYHTVRLHDLRHFMATQWLSEGVDVNTVSGRLGHRSAKMTLDVYGSFQPGPDRVAADAMDKLI